MTDSTLRIRDFNVWKISGSIFDGEGRKRAGGKGREKEEKEEKKVEEEEVKVEEENGKEYPKSLDSLMEEALDEAE